jgi:hypothetical protein
MTGEAGGRTVVRLPPTGTPQGKPERMRLNISLFEQALDVLVAGVSARIGAAGDLSIKRNTNSGRSEVIAECYGFNTIR